MKLLDDNRGTAALEFALVFPAFIGLVLGIFQLAYLLWIDSLLHYSVAAAARCGAVASVIYPCYGSGADNMVSTASALFGMAVSNIPSGTFASNSDCGGSGIVASYPVTFLLVAPVTLAASSCYPNYE